MNWTTELRNEPHTREPVCTVNHFARDVRANDASSNRSLVQTLPVAALFDLLGTRHTGLTPEEVGERQDRFGPNRIREANGKPLRQKLLAHFLHLMAVLLWVGGLIAFVAGLPQLGVAIWLVVLINGAFSFWLAWRYPN